MFSEEVGDDRISVTVKINPMLFIYRRSLPLSQRRCELRSPISTGITAPSQRSEKLRDK
jgi:hypothetical protein